MRLSIDSRFHARRQRGQRAIPPGPVARLARSRARPWAPRRLIANVFDGGAEDQSDDADRRPRAGRDDAQAMPDPFVEEVFARNEATKKPWVKAEMSSHIWTARLPADLAAGAHRVVVDAVDRIRRRRDRTAGAGGDRVACASAVDAVPSPPRWSGRMLCAPPREAVARSRDGRGSGGSTISHLALARDPLRAREPVALVPRTWPAPGRGAHDVLGDARASAPRPSRRNSSARRTRGSGPGYGAGRLVLGERLGVATRPFQRHCVRAVLRTTVVRPCRPFSASSVATASPPVPEAELRAGLAQHEAGLVAERLGEDRVVLAERLLELAEPQAFLRERGAVGDRSTTLSSSRSCR